MEKHTQHVICKVGSSLVSLYDMSKVIPKKLRISVYNSIVNSQLSYGISVWGAHTITNNLNPIFVLQKRALRNLFCISKVSKYVKGHTKQIFSKLNILSVYNIYNYMTLLSVDKLFKLRQPQYLCELTLYMIKEITVLIIPIPQFKCKHYQSNFCYQGPCLWNLLGSNSSICNEITASPSRNAMKTRLKKFLIKMQSYGQNENDVAWYQFNNSIEHFINQIKSINWLIKIAYAELPFSNKCYMRYLKMSHENSCLA